MAQDATRCICGAHLEGNICRNCGIEFKETYPAQTGQAPPPAPTTTLEEQLALHQVKLAHAQITSAQQQQKISELEKKHKEKEKLSNELERRMRANEEALSGAQEKFAQASKELSAYTSTGAKPETILAARKNLDELGQQIKTLGAQKTELDRVLKNYTRFGLPEKIEQELKARGELEKEKTHLEGTVKAKQGEITALGEKLTTSEQQARNLEGKAKSLEEVIARDRKYQDEIAPDWAEYVNFAEIALLDFLKDRISKPEFLTAQRRNAIALAGTFASEYWINALKKKNNIDWQYAYKLESSLKQFYDEFKKNPQAYETIECVADIFISAAMLLQGLPNKEDSADLLMKAIAFPLKYCINVGEELYESRREDVEEKIEKFRSENKIDLELGIIGNTLDEYIDSFEASSVSQPKPATETKPNTIAECIFCGAPMVMYMPTCGRCGARDSAAPLSELKSLEKAPGKKAESLDEYLKSLENSGEENASGRNIKSPLEEIGAAPQSDSKSFDILFKSAVACADKENYAEALKLFNQCIAIKPNNPTIWNNKGACLYRLGKLEDALSSYDKAIELNPKYIRAWEGKGIILEDKGILAGAIAAYQKAIELDADKKSDLASKIEDLYDSLTKKGQELAYSKAYADALAVLDSCIKIKPNDEEIWNSKGVVFGMMGKLENAILCFDKVTEIAPNHADAWIDKGNFLNRLGRPSDALICLDKALNIEPNNAAAWRINGLALEKLNYVDKAIASYKKAIELGYQHKDSLRIEIEDLKSRQRNEAQANIAEKREKILQKLRAERIEKRKLEYALGDCDRAIKYSHNAGEVWKNKGDILVKLGRTDEADIAYRRAVSLGYRNVPIIPHRTNLSRLNEAKKDDLDELDELLNEIKK